MLHFGLIGVHTALPCMTRRSLKTLQYRFGSVFRRATVDVSINCDTGFIITHGDNFLVDTSINAGVLS